MPQFFFHLRGGDAGLGLDQDGISLPDIETAYLEAFQAAKDMSQEWIRKGHNPRCYVFEVLNAAGEQVFELPFSEALDHQAGRRPTHLAQAVRTAKERAARIVDLAAEVTQEVKAVRANLCRSKELLASLKKQTADWASHAEPRRP